MKKLALLICLIGTFALGQNIRYDNVALGPKGPVPNATVAVCSQPATTSTQPCAPLSALCSSLTDTVCSQPNPLFADALGNFHFYVNRAATPVTVQVYGPGVAIPSLLTDQLVNPSSGLTPVLPAIVLTPVNINFGTTQTGTSSAAQNVTISNTGTAPLVVSSVVLSGNTDFSSSNISICNESIPVGASCVVPFEFSPSAPAAETATVTVNSNATGAAPTVALSGTGTGTATFTLTVNCSGTGNGGVNSNETPPLISATCTGGVATGNTSGSYASGSTPILTASPNSGFTFGSFSGGGCSTSPCTVTVSANTTVTATFNTSAASPTDYYVNSSTGLDTNTGAIGSPWLTIAHAQSAAVLGANGTTFHLTGSFTASQIACGSFTSTNFCFNLVGTSTAPIVWKADTLWGATLTGSGGAVGSNAVIAELIGTYTTLQNLVIDGTGSLTNIGVNLIASHTSILNSHVHDIPYSGPTGQGGACINMRAPDTTFTNRLAQSNVVHDCAWADTNNGSPGMHGIYLQGPLDSAYNNVVYRVRNYCVQLSHNVSSAVVANNLLFSCGSPNRFTSGAGGITIGSDTAANTNSTITNNIIRDLASGTFFIRQSFCSAGCTGTLVRNNICFGTGAAGNPPTGDACFELTSGSASLGFNVNEDPGMTTWNNQQSSPAVPTISGGIPVWSNANYHSASASSNPVNAGNTACAAGGAPFCTPATDLDGIIRPQGAAIDIGSYEFH